jgi:hypothetical protein
MLKAICGTTELPNASILFLSSLEGIPLETPQIEDLKNQLSSLNLCVDEFVPEDLNILPVKLLLKIDFSFLLELIFSRPLLVVSPINLPMTHNLFRLCGAPTLQAGIINDSVV